jgi:hypothetical protein
MGRSCSAHGEIRNAYKILVENPKGKRELGRCKDKSEHNIRMGLRKIGLEDVYWVHVAQDMAWWRALVDTVINIRVL